MSKISAEVVGTNGVKKGLNMMYALDIRTSGKTCKVPSPGAVSLDQKMSHNESASVGNRPHCKPALECAEDTALIRSSVEGAVSIQTRFEFVRIMSLPIVRIQRLETLPKGRIFPAFDCTTCDTKLS